MSTVHNYDRIQRLMRNVFPDPLLVYSYMWQHVPAHMGFPIDTDFVGCAATRRSTSGGAVMLGGHCVKHWASTQTVVSLSSGRQSFMEFPKVEQMRSVLKQWPETPASTLMSYCTQRPAPPWALCAGKASSASDISMAPARGYTNVYGPAALKSAK